MFGSIINPKKIKVKNCISQLIVNNKKITNKTDIANAFNDHFSTFGERLANKINTNKSPYNYLKNLNPYSFFLSPTDTIEIAKEIKKT